jgi:HD superfamily phosphohydrolase YqeK
MLADCNEAYDLLAKLGAPNRLLTHLKLVGEAAAELVRVYRELGVSVDANRIELGAAVHDAGKIVHQSEIDGPGALHEEAGKLMLLELGVQPEIAECCVTHAAWEGHQVSFEERSVALADKLWKGKRVAELELAVIDSVAAKLGVDRWSTFTRLDEAFEEIAAAAPPRLERSRA